MKNQDNVQENRTQPIKRDKHNRVFTPNGHWSRGMSSSMKKIIDQSEIRTIESYRFTLIEWRGSRRSKVLLNNKLFVI